MSLTSRPKSDRDRRREPGSPDRCFSCFKMGHWEVTYLRYLTYLSQESPNSSQSCGRNHRLFYDEERSRTAWLWAECSHRGRLRHPASHKLPKPQGREESYSLWNEQGPKMHVAGHHCHAKSWEWLHDIRRSESFEGGQKKQLARSEILESRCPRSADGDSDSSGTGSAAGISMSQEAGNALQFFPWALQVQCWEVWNLDR